jgi:hypothetical protein
LTGTAVTTLLSKVEKLDNQVNATILVEFIDWMKENQKSESYQASNLKVLTMFAQHLCTRDRNADFSP